MKGFRLNFCISVSFRFWVLENQTIGTLVGTIQVVDVDNVTRPCQYCVFWSQGNVNSQSSDSSISEKLLHGILINGTFNVELVRCT